MTLDQLEAFLAVVEHGSVAAASKALGRRRGTLQRHLTELEEHVGAELLLRSARGCAPTRAGEDFATRARSLLREVEALRAYARDAPRARRLRMGMPPGSPPQGYLVLTQLLRAHLPDVRFSYRLCGPDEALDDPDIDIFGQFSDHLRAGPHRTFVSLRYPVRLLASPAYLARRGRPQTVEDLEGHELLAWTGFRPERADRWPCVDGTTFEVHPLVVSDDTHALRKMASEGLGIGLLADLPQMVGKNRNEELEPVLDGVVGEQGRFRIILPERSAGLPEVRAVVEVLRSLGLPEVDWPEM